MEEESQSFKLQRFENWWNRLSFYNIVGVRHVKVSPLGTYHRTPRKADTESSIRRSNSYIQSRLSTDFL
jgi:hypothetical protein